MAPGQPLKHSTASKTGHAVLVLLMVFSTLKKLLRQLSGKTEK